MSMFRWFMNRVPPVIERPYVARIDAEVDIERLDIATIERVSDEATQFVLHDHNSFVIKCSYDCHDYFITRFRNKLDARKQEKLA